MTLEGPVVLTVEALHADDLIYALTAVKRQLKKGIVEGTIYFERVHWELKPWEPKEANHA